MKIEEFKTLNALEELRKHYFDCVVASMLLVYQLVALDHTYDCLDTSKVVIKQEIVSGVWQTYATFGTKRVPPAARLFEKTFTRANL